MRLGVIITLLVSALLTGGGYQLYERYEASVQQAGEQAHQAMVQGFANSLWKMHRTTLRPLLAAPVDPDMNMDVAVLLADVDSYFSDMPVEELQVYSPAGQLLMGQGNRTPDARLQYVLGYKVPASNLRMGDHANLSIHSLIPIVRDGNIELVMAITTSIPQGEYPYMLMLVAMLGVILLLVIMTQILSFASMRRSEKLIAKQYEENAELIAEAEHAKEETQQKSQFLANITHELRTPLNAIIGFSDILKNEFVPAPGQGNHTNYIHDIHSAGTHLLSLINDILDYSKAEAGKLELEVTEVNLTKVIQNCVRLVQPRAEIAQVRILESLPKDPVVLMADGKKFKQIMLNLLSNAVKFTPAEGVVKVAVWHEMGEDRWYFQVQDSGIGIAPKDISKAMSPFGQVDNALSRKFEGTGLGLPLTKKFVELMGGAFEIESEEGEGTTVTFSLPEEFAPKDGVTVKEVL